MPEMGGLPVTVSVAAQLTSSFEDFFRAEYLRLLRAMYLVSGSRQEAEELVQDAFLKVWERWPRVSSMDDPTGYLYRTGMNAFRSRARRARLAATRALRPGSARDAFADVDRQDVLIRSLAGLTTRQRAALVLTELLEYSSEDASRLLGVKPVTVRTLAAQGRAALRDRIDPDDV
jgi:RNA polymerase sigma-70 factor (ECF subfamily)